MTLTQYNTTVGQHGDSSLMLSTVVLSNENQTCRDLPRMGSPTSIGGGGCHTIDSRIELLHKQDWYKC